MQEVDAPRRSTRTSTQQATVVSRARSRSRTRAPVVEISSPQSASRPSSRSVSRPRRKSTATKRSSSRVRATSTVRSSSTSRRSAPVRQRNVKKDIVSEDLPAVTAAVTASIAPPTTTLSPLDTNTDSPCCVDRPLTPGRMRFFYELPEWTKDNPYIFTGYRVDFSWRQAFDSFFRLHNETFNVWTHALGCVFMGVVLVLILNHMPHSGHEYAYKHVTGYAGIDRGIGFVTELFSSDSNERVLYYHETMPSFCQDHYSSYHSFIYDNDIKLGAEFPETAVDATNSTVLPPWKFPAQCKPLRKDKFNPSLALNLRNFFKSLPTRSKEQLAALKAEAKNVLDKVPLPASMKEMRKNIKDKYVDIKEWTQVEFDKHTSEWTELLEALLSGVSATAGNARNHAVDVYEALIHFVTPIANSHDEVSRHTLKHPAFLFKYLDFGEEFLDTLPQWPIIVFIISAMICFGCSAIFHLFSAVSYDTYVILSRMDYAGISILIGGSNIPIIYYCFYCRPQAQVIYNVIISVGCLITFFVTVHPKYADKSYRALRTILFISLGLCGVFPFVHKTLIGEFDGTLLFYLAMMGCLYIGGAVVYVTQVPERCFPGHFDIFCSSHQWWHMFVFAATITHYLGVQYLYNWRILNVCTDAMLNSS